MDTHASADHLKSAVDRCLRTLVVIFFATFGTYRLTNAAGLDQQALTQIQASTFEVVAAKPTTDNLIYIKPLPLELQPFQERNDKYYSIGTAFSIGNNQFVTAAHVITFGIDSLWGVPALRDSNGHVYPIDTVDKFSLARDFVVFSVSGRPNGSSLKIDTRPELNSAVYAVGNALGTGVVVRDGLYTSKTPEEQDGRWQWLRFSAAASPGNSGGPLLDKDGAIVGIVVAKSPNENLNYALPIEEVLQAPAHQAEIDNRTTYRLDVFDTVQSGTFKGQIALPLTFAAFSASFVKLANAYSDSQLKALLTKDPEHTFPNGAGSSRLLHDVSRMGYVPALITRRQNGEWGMSEISTSRTVLAANGYVIAGSFGRNLLFRLRRPDGISAAALAADPEEFMKQLLKAGFLQRTIGSEKIQVIGLGKPTTDTIHVDTWQRRWQTRVWPLPYANSMFITLSLPTPDGSVTIGRYAMANNWHADLTDLKAIADFVSAGYWGTLSQWKEFLNSSTLLPPVLKLVKIDFDMGHRVNYSSNRLSFSITQEMQAITSESILGLGFSYINDQGKTAWDVGDIRVQRTIEDFGDWINIQRHVAPSADLDADYRSTWDKIVHREHPYDSAVYTAHDATSISAIAAAANTTAPPVVYSAFVGIAGTSSADSMKAKLDRLMGTLRVNEPSPEH
jgi:serine protease Do